MQLARPRGCENRTRISGSARWRWSRIGGDDSAETRSPRARAPDTPNSVKTLRYSCLDIVKPHFQHRHYVKHVAEADKSNNGGSARASERASDAATEAGEGLRTFRSSVPDRSLAERSIDRPTDRPTDRRSLLPHFLPRVPWNRLILPGANFVIGGELAELVGGARTLIMLSRY